MIISFWKKLLGENVRGLFEKLKKTCLRLGILIEMMEGNS
jgi:hypothetical protein